MSKQPFPDKTKITKAAFALLFSEMVQYCHQKAGTLDDFSRQLQQMGYPIGCTILEVIPQCSSNMKRQTSIVNMLIAIKEKVWPFLFGYQAHELEQQTENANCYMLYDYQPMVTQFISYPQDLKNHFSCCSFVGGIIEGILTSAGYPCQVSTHPNNSATEQEKKDKEVSDKVVYLIKFNEEATK